MLKLLNALAGNETHVTVQEIKYSRFDHAHQRERIVRSASVRPAPRVVETPEPVATPEPAVDMMAQLYCESSISTSVLRNALPNRFA